MVFLGGFNFSETSNYARAQYINKSSKPLALLRAAYSTIDVETRERNQSAKKKPIVPVGFDELIE